jgi:hypothetical protein
MASSFRLPNERSVATDITPTHAAITLGVVFNGSDAGFIYAYRALIVQSTFMNHL